MKLIVKIYSTNSCTHNNILIVVFLMNAEIRIYKIVRHTIQPSPMLDESRQELQTTDTLSCESMLLLVLEMMLLMFLQQACLP